MKRFSIFLILVFLGMSHTYHPTSAAEPNQDIVFPDGVEFEKLAELQQDFGSQLTTPGHWYGNFTGVPMDAIEKSMTAVIFAQTFSQQRDFYQKWAILPGSHGLEESLTTLLSNVGYGKIKYPSLSTLKQRGFFSSVNSFLSDLLYSSFSTSSSGYGRNNQLASISSIIEDEFRSKGAYPTPEELGARTIWDSYDQYLISELYDEIQYSLTYKPGCERSSGQGFQEECFVLKYRTESFSFDEAQQKIEDARKQMRFEPPVKKDYSELLQGVSVPDIPDLYSYIPADGAFLHVRDVDTLMNMLESDQLSESFLGIDLAQSLQKSVFQWFEIDTPEDLKLLLGNEFAVVFQGVDFESPNLAIIVDANINASLAKFVKGGRLTYKNANDRLYIGRSEALLDELIALKDGDSVVDSLDFQYAWSKKETDDFFGYIFVGDQYFEHITDFTTYTRLYKKLSESLCLNELQYIAWGYKAVYNTQIDQETLITLARQLLPRFECDMGRHAVQDGFVTHDALGTILDKKNVDELEYDSDNYSRSEIDGYSQAMYGYSNTWRAFLDPIGIVLQRDDTKTSIDFLMTPIPSIRQYNDIFQFLEGVGDDDFKIISNKHLRHGIVGLGLNFDIDRLQNRLFEDPNTTEAIREIEEEFLQGQSFFDFFGGEIALAVGSLESEVFEGYNLDKLDAFLAIEFVSQMKAREFIDLLMEEIMPEYQFDKYFQGITVDGLIKPLISQYRNNKIYSLPLFFWVEITIHYTYIDNYLYITLSRNAIENVIDTRLDTLGGADHLRLPEGKASGLVVWMDANALDTKMFTPQSSDEFLFTVRFLDDVFGGLLRSRFHSVSDFLRDAKHRDLTGISPQPVDIMMSGVRVYSKEDELYLQVDNATKRIDEGIPVTSSGEETAENLDGLRDLFVLEEAQNNSPESPTSMLFFSPEELESGVLISEENISELHTIVVFFVALDLAQEETLNKLKSLLFSLDVDDNELKIYSFMTNEKAPKIGKLFPPINMKGILIVITTFLTIILILSIRKNNTTQHTPMEPHD